MPLERYLALERRLHRRNRIMRVPLLRLKDYLNPMERYDAVQFKLRYHMEKETVQFVLELIQENLCAPVRRGVTIPPIIQLTTVLRFYATGSFQLTIADLINLSQSTISRLVVRISKRIAQLRDRFIKFPTQQNAPQYRTKFAQIAGFPGNIVI
jgi:hypothetical protein